MKIIQPSDAAALIPDGAVLMIGGFLGTATPSRLIDAVIKLGRQDLTVIANDTARQVSGSGNSSTQSRCAASSRVTSDHPETQRQMIAGELDVELAPQGTLIERIRAGGFGLGGVLTPTGLGTLAAQRKRAIDIDGKPSCW